MKRSLQETTTVTDPGSNDLEDRKKRKREDRKWKRARRLFLAVLAFYLCLTFVRSFRDTDAITLPEPVGIVYFVDEPNEELQAHENYHLHKQIEDEGAFLFYTKYLLGRGCIYEVEAGEDLEHPVCDVPWMREPSSDQIATDEEILAWYHEFVRANSLLTAKR